MDEVLYLYPTLPLFIKQIGGNESQVGLAMGIFICLLWFFGRLSEDCWTVLGGGCLLYLERDWYLAKTKNGTDATVLPALIASSPDWQ